jgi:hypothetical protein
MGERKNIVLLSWKKNTVLDEQKVKEEGQKKTRNGPQKSTIVPGVSCLGRREEK